MKKPYYILLLCCLLAAFSAQAKAASAEAEQAEWTVLFYYCGSDLESQYGFASQDILEIASCVRENGNENGNLPGTVNVVIETGGSKAWNNAASGLAIRADALQRWSFTFAPGCVNGDFRLEQELPLRSMAASQTLSDFIRWGTNAFPAKKYALVLWGHGDGAKTGIFADELFDNDVMALDELGQAVRNGGVYFEAVLLDACMMANLETACVLRDSAAWMIASEEMVPGHGTAVGKWLQELLYFPAQNGKQLGRSVCDMTKILYANSNDDHANSILTWSVIDLSRIDRVSEAIERFFETLNKIYREDAALLRAYCACFNNAEEYGEGEQHMLDIGSVFYHFVSGEGMDFRLRNEMIQALHDAVVYCVRGIGRSQARGLSFCYATDFTAEELDIYARNCMSPHYLAFLDALSAWTAPDYIYETVERLPEIETLSAYGLKLEKRMSAQGVPGIVFPDASLFGGVNYILYRKDERAKHLTRLGRTMCRAYAPEENILLYSAVEPWLWPAIDGEPCDIELVSATDTQALYSIPIRIGSDVWNLRYERAYEMYLTNMSEDKNKAHLSLYTVYGLWEGYDDDTVMLSRNVISLAQMAGQEYHTLYPLDGSGDPRKTKYVTGGLHTLYRTLDLEAAVLPAGTYYLEYEIQDMFMRPISLDRIEMYWDGRNLTFPEGFIWDGTVELALE